MFIEIKLNFVGQKIFCILSEEYTLIKDYRNHKDIKKLNIF